MDPAFHLRSDPYIKRRGLIRRAYLKNTVVVDPWYSSDLTAAESTCKAFFNSCSIRSIVDLGETRILNTAKKDRKFLGIELKNQA
jgi:hypothetical protein